MNSQRKLLPFNSPITNNFAFQSESASSSFPSNGNVSAYNSHMYSADPLFLRHPASLYYNESSDIDNQFFQGYDDVLSAAFDRVSIRNLHGNVAGESSALRGVNGAGDSNMHAFNEGWQQQRPASVGSSYSNSNGNMGMGSAYSGYRNSFGSVECMDGPMDYIPLRNLLGRDSQNTSVLRSYSGIGDGYGVSENGMYFNGGLGYGGQGRMNRMDSNGGLGYGDHGRMMRSQVGIDMTGDSRNPPYYPWNDGPSLPQGNGVYGYEGNLVTQGKRLNHLSDKRYASMKSRECEGKYLLDGNGESKINWSALLREYSSFELKGYFYLIAKDQGGCRLSQEMLTETNGKDADFIFDDIFIHIIDLLVHPIGNYLVQKVLEFCTDDRRMRLLVKIREIPRYLISLSLNTHGTRVVQTLIQSIRGRLQISTVKTLLEPGFPDLVRDLNGNHVLQSCLKSFSTEDNAFIFNAAIRYCVSIATHQHGCCVLQRCVEHATGEYRENLVNEISANALCLADDPFGNYVVQFVIKFASRSAIAIMNSRLQGQYVYLSKQKCSSHVVEKCIIFFEDFRPRIIQELLSIPQFDQLMQDPFANYVIKKALSVSEGRLYDSLVQAIQPHKILRTNPHCKGLFSYINARKDDIPPLSNEIN